MDASCEQKAVEKSDIVSEPNLHLLVSCSMPWTLLVPWFESCIRLDPRGLAILRELVAWEVLPAGEDAQTCALRHEFDNVWIKFLRSDVRDVAELR
jgi:hypothetical protein